MKTAMKVSGGQFMMCTVRNVLFCAVFFLHIFVHFRGARLTRKDDNNHALISRWRNAVGSGIFCF